MQKINRNSKGRWLLGGVILSLLTSLAVFVLLLSAERNVLAGFEKRTVYVSKNPITAGMILSAENYQEYFELREVDAGAVSSEIGETGQQVLESFVEGEGTKWVSLVYLPEGTVADDHFFQPMNAITSLMNEPVLLGVKADDLYQVAGGIIRSGDRIHVYVQQEEAEEVTLRWTNLYVAQVFDSAGNLITSEDTKAATRLNLYLEKEDVEEFYSGISANRLRAVKVCDDHT